jgi:uncharacterized FlaG/YvyC family protein
MGRVSAYKKNSLPQAGRAGGYIARALKNNNEWQVREKVSIPTNKCLVEKVKHITDNIEEWDSKTKYDAQFQIFDYTGETVVAVIGCTRKELMELL